MAVRDDAQFFGLLAAVPQGSVATARVRTRARSLNTICCNRPVAAGFNSPSDRNL